MSAAERDYDVVIIGAGPAGSTAAIHCASHGLRTLCVDDWSTPQNAPSLGGTYVNAGCIPALTLLDVATRYQDMLNGRLDQQGILSSTAPTIDMARLLAHKDQTVHNQHQLIAQRFSQAGVVSIHGRGLLRENRQVEITLHDASQQPYLISSESIILATGSQSIQLETIDMACPLILDSNQAMRLDSIPETLGIIGSGVIGLEHAVIWSALGSKVILLEAQEDFLPFCDEQIAEEAMHHYHNNGLDIRMGARVLSSQRSSSTGKLIVEYEDNSGIQQITVDCMFMAAGRRPNTNGLYADEVDLLLDEQGFVNTDKHCQTNLPGIYAIGDLIRGPMLAHKGAEEGIFVADILADKQPILDYSVIPNVIYTSPEIAWVGLTEQALRTSGENYSCAVIPFSENTRSSTLQRTNGFVKLLSRKEDDRIMGMHVIGHNASELISEGVLAMEFAASAEDVARTIHANPSLSRSIQDAALKLARSNSRGCVR